MVAHCSLVWEKRLQGFEEIGMVPVLSSRQPSLWPGNHYRLSDGAVAHIARMEISARACRGGSCDLQMTGVSEKKKLTRLVHFCYCAVLQQSSWSLLPGTRPAPSEASFSSKTCSPSSSSSWASTTWAEYAPDCF